MKIIELAKEIIFLLVIFIPNVYSQQNIGYQIDTHICWNSEIVSSTHVLVSDYKKLYHAVRPSLVFWYTVIPKNKKVNITVEYRRNRNGAVVWENGPSFDVTPNRLATMKLLTETGKDVNWQILIRSTDISEGMLSLENTSIGKECVI